MRAFVVIETQEAVQAPLQGRAAREVTSAEGHTPVFLQDGALQTFHEAIGPGMAGFGPRVAEAELATGRIERAMELRPTAGEHALHPPAGAPIVGHQDRPQEVGGAAAV